MRQRSAAEGLCTLQRGSSEYSDVALDFLYLCLRGGPILFEVIFSV